MQRAQGRRSDRSDGRIRPGLHFDNRQTAAGVGPGGGLPMSPQAAEPAATDAVSIFTALEEQLGLKLEPQTGPAEVLVIDRVERPTPN